MDLATQLRYGSSAGAAQQLLNFASEKLHAGAFASALIDARDGHNSAFLPHLSYAQRAVE
jgi:hypothetical protein